MNIIENLNFIRNRILNGTAQIFAYKESWGIEFCFEELNSAFSPEKSFGHSKVEIISLDDLKTLPRDVLYSFGFGNWDGNLVTIPLWLVPFIDQSSQVICIDGSTSTLSDCDKDVRFGCIAFGFIPVDRAK